MQKKRIVG
jgi:hypothetical protein